MNDETELNDKSRAEGHPRLNDGLADVLWRLRDIREMLMHTGFSGKSTYGCDEWSTPIVNLDSAIKRVESIQAANMEVSRKQKRLQNYE